MTQLSFAALFLLLLTGSVFLHKLPFGVLFLYLGASIITFLVYHSDKSAARKDRWRTPENTLHLLGLIGGWPGALIAQRLLHHKSRKLPFQIVFWATALLNFSGLIWLLSPSGSHILHTLL